MLPSFLRRGPTARAVPIYLLLSGLGSLIYSMIVTVNLLYHVETVGLAALELVLVGTTLEAVIVLFEIPTGVVADLVSRRRSILFGNALIGVGCIVESRIPVFAAILVAQGPWGIGDTVTSGATELRKGFASEQRGRVDANAGYLLAGARGTGARSIW